MRFINKINIVFLNKNMVFEQFLADFLELLSEDHSPASISKVGNRSIK